MSGVGCFSWCGLGKKLPKGQFQDELKTSRTLNEEDIPSMEEYALDGAKKAITLLQGAAVLIPVPFFQDVLQVAVDVIQACEEVSAIEDQVKSLQSRVGNIMIVIVDRMTHRDNDTEAITSAAKELEEEIKTLQRKHYLCVNYYYTIVNLVESSPPLAGEGIAWEFWNLPPTDKEACRRIYTDINSSTEQDPHLDNLLETLGYMPFAVTLKARLARESQANAEELLEQWKQVGTLLISSANNAEKSINCSISLSVDSQLMKNEPDALPLLVILSLLPAGTTRENLKYWAPFLKSGIRL
ncbi:hypothetical protein M422DRAFT_43156 [Sphaerobolus stellatus SS14]|nr:hypothetical protein M422DRAFT_43156 [Sphaerobolus stellatus SS14]